MRTEKIRKCISVDKQFISYVDSARAPREDFSACLNRLVMEQHERSDGLKTLLKEAVKESIRESGSIRQLKDAIDSFEANLITTLKDFSQEQGRAISGVNLIIDAINQLSLAMSSKPKQEPFKIGGRG